MADTNLMTKTISEFRVFAEKLKVKFCSQIGLRESRFFEKSAFDYLVSSHFTEQELLGYDDDFIHCAVILAQTDGQLFFEELERIRLWSGHCFFVILPIIRHFISQS